MADGNPYYTPQPSFFDRFSQGIGLGLSIRQASDRAKQIEIQTQEQKMRMEDMRQKQQTLQGVLRGRRRAQDLYERTATGGAPALPQTEEPGDPALGMQVEGQPGAAQPGRPMTLQEIVTHAALGEGKFQQGMFRGAGGGGAESRAFATVGEALAFQRSPEFKEAYPLGARLTQTSRGFAFTGINPSDPAANTFHSSLQQPGGNRPQALSDYNQSRYATEAAVRAGGVSGPAAAALGEAVPPMPPMSRPERPIGERSLNDMTISELAAQGAPGQAPPGQSQILRAEAAKTTAREKAQVDVENTPSARSGKQNIAAGTAQGRREVEAQEKLKDVAATEQIIEDVKILSQRLNTAKGGAGRFVQGAGNLAGSLLQTNTDAADLTGLRDSYSLSLARSILSERGVLTNQDRSYA